MGKYRVCIGTGIHVSACNNRDIFPSIQSFGTCMELLETQQPSPEQGILCYPIHSCKLGSDYEPLACIQNIWYGHWSTAHTNVKKLLNNLWTNSYFNFFSELKGMERRFNIIKTVIRPS
jgi:hypothetical protein